MTATSRKYFKPIVNTNFIIDIKNGILIFTIKIKYYVILFAFRKGEFLKWIIK